MRIFKSYTLALIVGALTISGCTICCEPPPDPITSSLAFRISKGNEHLPESILNKIKISYFQNGYKQYMTNYDWLVFDTSFGREVLVTRRIGELSFNDSIKNFYLEYPDEDVDTIYADYRKVDPNDSAAKSCYCAAPLMELLFNGKGVSIDSNYRTDLVYLFEK